MVHFLGEVWPRVSKNTMVVILETSLISILGSVSCGLLLLVGYCFLFPPYPSSSTASQCCPSTDVEGGPSYQILPELLVQQQLTFMQRKAYFYFWGGKEICSTAGCGKALIWPFAEAGWLYHVMAQPGHPQAGAMENSL